MTETNTNNTQRHFFNGEDFVFTRNSDTGEFIGGGYKINSFFLKDDMPVMTTYNNSDQSGEKVSSQFENLAVPAGLFYINTRVPKKNVELSFDEHFNNHKMAPDEIMDKLFTLIEVDKKRKRKTKKNNIKLNKKNTRKYK
jgi:hypothetical protein